MNLGVSENSDILLVIKMKNPEDDTIVDSAQKYNIFKKNKSGLSKGAIAGIIIGFLALLIVIAIIVCCCKKRREVLVGRTTEIYTIKEPVNRSQY